MFNGVLVLGTVVFFSAGGVDKGVDSGFLRLERALTEAGKEWPLKVHIWGGVENWVAKDYTVCILDGVRVDVEKFLTGWAAGKIVLRHAALKADMKTLRRVEGVSKKGVAD